MDKKIISDIINSSLNGVKFEITRKNIERRYLVSFKQIVPEDKMCEISTKIKALGAKEVNTDSKAIEIWP